MLKNVGDCGRVRGSDGMEWEDLNNIDYITRIHNTESYCEYFHKNNAFVITHNMIVVVGDVQEKKDEKRGGWTVREKGWMR